ncbi:MAG: PIN domain-containing protein [Limisphaerales bacterium]
MADVIFWDTSALVAATTRPELRGRLPGGVTRAHALAELFSTLTGGWMERDGQRYKVGPDAAAALARAYAAKLRVVELDGPEVLAALDEAKSLGVTGGRIYDHLHATAARREKATELLTTDRNDFTGLLPATVTVTVL